MYTMLRLICITIGDWVCWESNPLTFLHATRGRDVMCQLGVTSKQCILILKSGGVSVLECRPIGMGNPMSQKRK